MYLSVKMKSINAFLKENVLIDIKIKELIVE